jgi:hypothetical protein
LQWLDLLFSFFSESNALSGYFASTELSTMSNLVLLNLGRFVRSFVCHALRFCNLAASNAYSFVPGSLTIENSLALDSAVAWIMSFAFVQPTIHFLELFMVSSWRPCPISIG